MIIVKQNIDRKTNLKSVPISNVKKVQLTRTVTPTGVYYVSNEVFYPETGFVILNNYLISPSNYSIEKLDLGDYNAVKINNDPGVNSRVELIAAFK